MTLKKVKVEDMKKGILTTFSAAMLIYTASASAQSMKTFPNVRVPAPFTNAYAQRCAGRTHPAGGIEALNCEQILQQAQNFGGNSNAGPPAYRSRIQRTQNGYAVIVSNVGRTPIICQVMIDGYKWFGTSQQKFVDKMPLTISPGREEMVEWIGMQPVGARYSVSSCENR